MAKSIYVRNGVRAVAVASVALLAACGGDGGGLSDPPVRPTDAYSTNVKRLVERGIDATVTEPKFGTSGSVFQTAGAGAPGDAGIQLRGGAFRIGVTLADGSQISLDPEDHLYASMETDSPTRRKAEAATFLDYGDGHITVAGGTIDYNPNELGDWIAGGYWLHVQGDWRNGGVDGALIGALVDGPNVSPRAGVPGTGTAKYEGIAAGIYAFRAGMDALTPDASEVGEYAGKFTAEADFGTGMVWGAVGGITLEGFAEHPDGQMEEFSGVPYPASLVLDPAPIRPDGSVTGEVRIESDALRIVGTDGSWGARLSARDDGAGNPRGIAGTHGGTAVTAGGSKAIFVGVHAGPTGDF